MPRLKDSFSQKLSLGLPLSLFVFFTFSGCAGALFGGSVPKQAKDLEELTTRQASAEEEKLLDRCLYQVFKTQQAHRAKTGSYHSSARSLRVSESCGKIKLSLERRDTGFLAVAKIRDGDSVVRWTVDERGEVVEHDDSNMELGDF